MTWDELTDAASKCEKCPLAKTRTNLVFGVGNRNADIMFVGEAPGENEDKTGIPFVGAAGKHLDRHLTAVGIDREDVYIANILKCRPPHNRDPLPEEEDECIDFLRGQVKLVKPKIIVCLGRIAAKRLIDENFRITASHGVFYKKGTFYITAVYHPSALLRDPKKNEDMYLDLKNVVNKLREINGGEI